MPQRFRSRSRWICGCPHSTGNRSRSVARATGLATIRFKLEEDPLAAVITFVDRGMPYDPLSTAAPDITLPADDREIGGLGVFIVRRTMDDVKYSYEEGQNILTITKRFGRAE